MPTDDHSRDDDAAAIAAAVRTLATEAYEVLTRATAGEPGEHREVVGNLLRRIECVRPVLGGARSTKGRLEPLHLWLDGLQRQAIVLQETGRPRGLTGHLEGRPEESPG